ncbi:hypothetical protein HMPREF9622_02432 [Cutibacterium modestum HL037PA3]|nr:hypothetical protein HMPREF9622_02432 [Cutibacterium modestum HL037PA3]
MDGPKDHNHPYGSPRMGRISPTQLSLNSQCAGHTAPKWSGFVSVWALH